AERDDRNETGFAGFLRQKPCDRDGFEEDERRLRPRRGKRRDQRDRKSDRPERRDGRRACVSEATTTALEENRNRREEPEPGKEWREPPRHPSGGEDPPSVHDRNERWIVPCGVDRERVAHERGVDAAVRGEPDSLDSPEVEEIGGGRGRRPKADGKVEERRAAQQDGPEHDSASGKGAWENGSGKSPPPRSSGEREDGQRQGDRGNAPGNPGDREEHRLESQSDAPPAESDCRPGWQREGPNGRMPCDSPSQESQRELRAEKNEAGHHRRAPRSKTAPRSAWKTFLRPSVPRT